MHLRAVLIDDESWVRETLKRIGKWRESGFRIVGEAADGLSGLECVRELKPDLVVTDMNMPGIDGVALLRELSADGNPAKVIVVSGYDDYRYIRQAMQSRAVDYLLKPVKEDELNALLRRCADEIERERALAAERAPIPDLTIIGLADPAWIREYAELCDVLATCLLSRSASGAERVLGMMEALLARESDGCLALKLLIRVNYDFQLLIEDAVVAQGLALERLLAPESISFPLSGLATPAALIAHWRRAFANAIQAMADDLQRKNRIDVPRIRDWIASRYAEPITLEEVAERFSVSREYLSTLFRKETGKTFSDYLVSLRMEKIRELIVEYDVPIQRAAEMVGYIDISSFYKSFKKYFGITPGEMRKGGN